MGRPREAPIESEADLPPEEFERRRLVAFRRIGEHWMDVSNERARNRAKKRQIIERVRGVPGVYPTPPKPSLAEMERAADELDALGPSTPGLTTEQIRAGVAAQGAQA